MPSQFRVPATSLDAELCRATDELFWTFLKIALAAFRAEVVGLALVLDFRRLLFIYFHFANWINGHGYLQVVLLQRRLYMDCRLQIVMAWSCTALR